MSYSDYEKGRDGIGSGSGMDYLKGVAERERQRAEMAYKPPPSPPPPPPRVDFTPTQFPDASSTRGAQTSASQPAVSGGKTQYPEMLVVMAQLGGMFGVPVGLVWACYSMVVAHHFDWTKLLAGAILGAAGGALAGAALYVALQVLLFALGIAALVAALWLLGFLFKIGAKVWAFFGG